MVKKRLYPSILSIFLCGSDVKGIEDYSGLVKNLTKNRLKAEKKEGVALGEGSLLRGITRGKSSLLADGRKIQVGLALPNIRFLVWQVLSPPPFSPPYSPPLSLLKAGLSLSPALLLFILPR